MWSEEREREIEREREREERKRVRGGRERDGYYNNRTSLAVY